MESFKQEFTRIKKELMKMPVIESALVELLKNMEMMCLQSEKQQQAILSYMEANAKERSIISERMTKLNVRDLPAMKSKVSEVSSSRDIGETDAERKSQLDEVSADRSKFKKVGMPVFTGDDPESWLFRAERCFQIHKLTKSEKMLVSTICFDGPTLNWEGTVCGQFLRIQQETTVEEYQNLLDKPKGLAEMMLTAHLVENREILGNEANLNGYGDGKYPSQLATGTSKRLPDAEFQLRREKGLCFKCNEKYSTDHKCKMKEQREFRMFVENNNNEELEIIEEVDSEVAELRTAEVQPHTTACVELSINYVVGLNDPGTMKVRGSLQGTAIQGKGVCESLEVKMKEWTVKEDFLPLELGGVDVILGMQWLYSLGVTVCDWKNLTLTFYDNEKQICIKGDPSLTKARVSLKNLMKTWEKQDHGYLIECRSIEIVELNELMVHQKEEREVTEEKLIPILNQFSDIFDWPEKLPPRRSIEHHIHLKEGTNPVNVRPYRYAYHQKEEMERLVSEMFASGIIRPSVSPYSSPILLVKKKDGNWRFCVDYRALNNVTVPNKFSILVVEELFHELGGASLFTKIDLKVRYYQIRMVDEDIEKTAFRIHEGHYEFLVMPFGLTNAPATFQSLMNSIFKPYLRRFVLHELFANRKKCSFGMARVEYLGHLISDKGVEVDSEKINAIADWPKPTNVRETRDFLGLTGYYRRFVHQYGAMAAPLT
ncbi:Ty3/gypsy retrotransposon protein [Cucumis melo var. makuwa]|uniref:Ty3/gypsy retrotransposon protein n=1 Tax=Cucumis melo var. makuwa TaxID=1194695 RepID=A0A5D3D216_CUCMM|nr:Ty3/gypsy retrotransposon protein [Cucumis melo var. makuwa]TYK17927.1 Ty3/gypsy retrotransposon protein [Cucumis melo var. makuwa]